MPRNVEILYQDEAKLGMRVEFIVSPGDFISYLRKGAVKFSTSETIKGSIVKLSKAKVDVATKGGTVMFSARTWGGYEPKWAPTGYNARQIPLRKVKGEAD